MLDISYKISNNGFYHIIWMKNSKNKTVDIVILDMNNICIGTSSNPKIRWFVHVFSVYWLGSEVYNYWIITINYQMTIIYYIDGTTY